LWYRPKNVKAQALLCVFAHPWTISEPILGKTCDSIAYLQKSRG
jgi:hypothetical protein